MKVKNKLHDHNYYHLSVPYITSQESKTLLQELIFKDPEFKNCLPTVIFIKMEIEIPFLMLITHVLQNGFLWYLHYQLGNWEGGGRIKL